MLLLLLLLNFHKFILIYLDLIIYALLLQILLLFLHFNCISVCFSLVLCTSYLRCCLQNNGPHLTHTVLN